MFKAAVAKAAFSSAVDKAIGTARGAVALPQNKISWEEYNCEWRVARVHPRG
jgi:hypothetical protein